MLNRLIDHDLRSHRVLRLASFRAAVLDIAHRLRMGLGSEEAYYQLVALSDDIERWSERLGDTIRVSVNLELPK